MPKNRLPPAALVEQFQESIKGYAASHPNMPLHLIAVDVIDLEQIFSAFESGDQWLANGLVYKLFRDVRKEIPEAVLKFIFKHS